jgi:hypothetical protein
MLFSYRRYSLYSLLVAAFAFAATCVFALPASAQASHWASADDATAKSLIEMERKWAEAGCNHNGIEKTILADDFHGIAPDGSHYEKKDMVTESENTKTSERECVMYKVTVHYFGDNMAVLYGSESALTKAKDGHEYRRKLTWVDTWLKRNEKWQIVAVEDMPSEMK